MPDTDRYSGLSDQAAANARDLLVLGCERLLSHAPDVHYTEGVQRWSAINHRVEIVHGGWLEEGDCSSTCTWLLWNALFVAHNLHDIVNGANWLAGYTGTLSRHGKPVEHIEDILEGDLILYGYAFPYLHVTMALGGGECFSHGSEAGPFREPIDYRPDRAMIRRYI